MASEGVIAVSEGSIWPARAVAWSSASGKVARNGTTSMSRRAGPTAWSATQTEAGVHFKALPESISTARFKRAFLDDMP
jgi:hypothetical protein